MGIRASAGQWWLGSGGEELFAARLLLNATSLSVSPDSARRADLVARRATAGLRGFVQMPDGSAPTNDLRVVAWSADLEIGASLGEDGSFHLLAVGWIEEGIYDGPSPLFTKPVSPGSPRRFYGVELVP